jgi:hypothetical protein
MDRMRLTVDSAGRVTLTYTDPIDDVRRERTFVAPEAGGYIRELRRDGSSTQPCGALASTGDTLIGSRADLPAIIRREYRRMRREYRRAFAEKW